MHRYGWVPMKEKHQKSKDVAEKLRAENTPPLHIDHRGIRVKRGFSLTSEPVTEVA